ncbi:MAG: hypothetical protein D4S00_01950 [Streptomycetaceae bacterium]|nr:MAG: hypothetical protein D4S00_01950 [Streptomycetaceae bacterium]
MSAPASVIELANARIQAREVKDFSLADRLRNLIAQAGFEVVDVANGYELREKAAFITLAFARDIRPIDLEKEVSVALIVDGFTDDALESVNLVKANSDCGVVILSIGDPGRLVEAMDSRTYLFAVQPGASWGDCANALLQKIESQFVVMIDPATRFMGDAISPAIEELQKGEFVAVGWRGGLIDTDNEWQSVLDRGPGEVDVVHSFFMAFNREAVLETGGFNLRAVYFQNADIELSLKIRQAGGRLLQMELPLELGRHHAIEDADPVYREAHAAKNLNRLLERFKGKSAILSPRR